MCSNHLRDLRQDHVVGLWCPYRSSACLGTCRSVVRGARRCGTCKTVVEARLRASVFRDGDMYVDIAPGRVGIRAHLVGFLGERLGLGPRQMRQ